MERYPLIGLCRFSFVGRGDWDSFRKPGEDQNDEAQRKAIAEKLYAPDRLEQRFRTFEHILLASLDAQTDKDFHLFVLTSILMPDHYQKRLAALCEARPYVKLIVSDATNVNAGLLDDINRIRDEYNKQPVQFRIDDDDGFAADYIERLQRAAQAMAGYPNFAYSRPRGAVVTLYAGKEPSFYKLHQHFHSAGCACRLFWRDQTVFSYGHFALGNRFPTMIDNSGLGHIAVKPQGHSSVSLDSSERARHGHKAIDRAEFTELLKKHFPFIDMDRLTKL